MTFHLLKQLKTDKCVFLSAIILLSLILSVPALAQPGKSANNFRLVLLHSGKDTGFDFNALKLTTSFNSPIAASEYLTKLVPLIQSKGYPAASIDSSFRNDSSIIVYLYRGEPFRMAELDVTAVDARAIPTRFRRGDRKIINAISFYDYGLLQEQLLRYYENTGYPFAYVFLDSVSYSANEYKAKMKVEKGRLYAIDSIHVSGKVSINNRFLQHHLGIRNGSPYNRSRLQQVDQRILALNFLAAQQRSDLTMLGTGAILNLYLKQTRSNQFSFIAGLMPASQYTGKLMLTGDLNMDCRNMLGNGERILFKWQQLQPSSPRLNLGYSQSYIFNSDYGLDFLFELFRKDSSFLQINTTLGTQYAFNAEKNLKLYFHWQSNRLLSGAIDTQLVKQLRKLPDNGDCSSTNLGFAYQLNNTDYRFNPGKGNELDISGMLGLKKIIRNNDVTSLNDSGYSFASLYDSIRLNNYQVRMKLSAFHYFPIGKVSVIKAGIQTGLYASPEIFRNDLFQIGGNKLMRGFDEESLYATTYGVFTAEYRLRFQTKSYVSFFGDYGLLRFRYNYKDVSNNLLGIGAGIAFETKAGFLNLSYAVGRRSDVPFSIRQSSKIHMGYVNYF